MPYNKKTGNKKASRLIDQETSDKELIDRTSKGEEAAFNELMRRYKSKLYAFISNYVKDNDAAQDILQETFTKVYFKAESFNPTYKFSTWLYQIAINLCRDWGRKKTLKQLISLDAIFTNTSTQTLHETLSDPLSDTEHLVIKRSELRFLEQEIQKLPHKLKTSLILYAVEGNSQDKCAEILGVTPKTIETRIYRARKTLSQKLAKKI